MFITFYGGITAKGLRGQELEKESANGEIICGTAD